VSGLIFGQPELAVSVETRPPRRGSNHREGRVANFRRGGATQWGPWEKQSARPTGDRSIDRSGDCQDPQDPPLRHDSIVSGSHQDTQETW